MGVPANCSDCGAEWFVSTPDYGSGAEYAHYCSRTGSRRTYHDRNGSRYLGGGRWSKGPDTDEPQDDLPPGYFEARREFLFANAAATHEPGCTCMCCEINGRKAKATESIESRKEQHQ